MPRRSAKSAGPAKRRHYLKEWREFRGMTQRQVAEQLGDSESNISQLENGKQGYTQWKLESLARIYGTDTASLLSRNPLTNPPPPPEVVSMYDALAIEDKPLALDLMQLLRDRRPTS